MMIDRDIDQAQALVIDSNPTSRSVMAAQLRDLGVGHVKQTGRVNEARLALEQRPYDIVLCDYHFEGSDMSGQDLLDELRRENLLPYSTVFIMVTGEATYATVVEAAEAALDSYLLKPYTASALGERLGEARRRKRVLADIFEAMEQQQLGTAAKICLRRFQGRESYWLFCARVAAELLLKMDQHEQARKVYEVVAQEKGIPWAKLGIARAQFAAGEVSPARRSVEAVLRESPEHADAYDVLGRIQVDQGELAQALTTYRIASQLTPGCLLRLQHCGTLAFYQGERDEAIRMLERVIAMGLKSKLFDALTLMLMAFLRHDTGDTKALVIAHDYIKKFVERHPESKRLKRMELTANALRLLLARQPEQALALARELAEGIAADNFDVEGSNLVLALWTRLPEAHVPHEELEALVRQIALRFCVSKAVTEVLVASAQRSERLVTLIRSCQSEITTIAEEAMAHSVRGKPRSAVESLLRQGTDTRNAKLIEMAGLVVRRHADTIEGRDALMAEATQLQQRFCQPVTHLAGVRRTGRSPGGLVLRT
ncbi:response regulator [Aquabacterium sp.]|uniref:response regulator n=1 Tax=Aquabacterium sp. TaxID=1872578 RepID=UPI003784D205